MTKVEARKVLKEMKTLVDTGCKFSIIDENFEQYAMFEGLRDAKKYAQALSIAKNISIWVIKFNGEEVAEYFAE